MAKKKPARRKGETVNLKPDTGDGQTVKHRKLATQPKGNGSKNKSRATVKRSNEAKPTKPKTEQIREAKDVEAVETSLHDLRAANLAKLPSRIPFRICEDNFPECTLWRDGSSIVVDIEEHIYSKYWWHKYHARVFADALVRAATRLKHEGHPIEHPTIDSDDDIHIFVHWLTVLPCTLTADELIASIQASFDLVWQRANLMLEHSDSVLVLGKDTGESFEKLRLIAANLEGHGYYAYIIKEQPDKIGESVIQKVLRFALSSKYIVVENSEPSGHLYEIPHVTKLAECVTIVLQEEGKGATWMFEDAYAKHKHWKKFVYNTRTFEVVIAEAVAWAEDFIQQFGQFQVKALPWLQKRSP